MIVRIDRADDPRVADYRDVKEAKLFVERGVFVAEGIEVVRTLLTKSRFPVRSVFCTDRLLPRVLADAGDALVYVADGEVLSEVAGFDVHRGCLALGERPGAEQGPDVLTGLSNRSVVLVLEALSNHDNVGAVFRNARGFGAGAVLLDPSCADPLYRKAIRVSMGAVLTVPFARLSPWPEALDRLDAKGCALWAFTPSTGAEDLAALASGRAAPIPGPLALVFGTEGAGLSEAVLARASRRWRIPMAEGADSLNVAVASAVALFAINAGANRLTP
jgi:tRNA G18 (ribose-2'-O)-methylase SpoU